MNSHTLLELVYGEALKKKRSQGEAFSHGKYSHLGWREKSWRKGDKNTAGKVQYKTMCVGGYALVQLGLESGIKDCSITELGDLQFVSYLERRFKTELGDLSSLLGLSSYSELIRWNDESTDAEMLGLIRSKLQS